MALAARLVDRGAWQASRIKYCEVREPGFRGRSMMAAGSVTLLATDRAVGRLGTGLVHDGSEIGCVAEQTAHHAVPLEQGVAQVLVWVFGPLGQAGGQVPSRAARRVIMGDAEHPRSS